jgi:rhodanese-related sulfurtransferase
MKLKEHSTASGRKLASRSDAVVLPAMLMLLVGVYASTADADDLAAYRQTIREKYPTVRQMSTEDLADRMSDTNRVPPLLLDVREEIEYRVSHLKDAQWVRKNDRGRLVASGLASQRPLVVYCSVGARSSEFAWELQMTGHTNVFNLDGSIFQWANEGRPVFSGSNVVIRVHPYNRKWGRFLRKELHAYAPAVK